MGNCSTCKHLREPVEECLLDEDGDCLGYEEDPNAKTLCGGCYEAIVEGGRLCIACAEDAAWTEHDRRELTTLRASVAELERENGRMATDIAFHLPRKCDADCPNCRAMKAESRASAAEQRVTELEMEVKRLRGFCSTCGDSGFSGPTQDYGGVCPECAGQSVYGEPLLKAAEQHVKRLEGVLRTIAGGPHWGTPDVCRPYCPSCAARAALAASDEAPALEVGND